MAVPNCSGGIALFTLLGDLIYSMDYSKQLRWHLNLCTALQEILGLPEPPHFLVCFYTGSFDRWIDPIITKQVRVSAEAHPPLWRYQPLLNAICETVDLVGQPVQIGQEVGNPLV